MAIRHVRLIFSHSVILLSETLYSALQVTVNYLRHLQIDYLYYITNRRDLSDSTSEVTSIWRSANTIIIF